MFKIGVFAIIFDEKKRVLLCHRRDYDLWNLPGGGLENGEAPWECAIRETKEETGLDVKIKKLSGIYSKPEKDEIVFQYICEVVDGEITLNDEADEIKYFAFERIPKNTSRKQIERVQDALKNKSEPIMKKQIGKSSIQMVKERL